MRRMGVKGVRSRVRLVVRCAVLCLTNSKLSPINGALLLLMRAYAPVCPALARVLIPAAFLGVCTSRVCVISSHGAASSSIHEQFNCSTNWEGVGIVLSI